MIVRRLRGILGDRMGATLVEFALISPVLCMLLLGFIDLGYRSYVASVIQGALQEAARNATVGNKTGAQIDALVISRLKSFSKYSPPVINKTSDSDYSGVQMPEKITSDTAPVGTYNVGDCYEDANNNGKYDLDRGKTGLGGADDVVYYEIVLTFPRIVPLGKILGFSDTQTIRAATVMQNQPFAARSVPPVLCK